MKSVFSEKHYRDFLKPRRDLWEEVYSSQTDHKRWSRYYHKRLESVFAFLVPPGQKVLELGCGEGDLLNSVRPSFGVGIDFSQNAINKAKKKHHNLSFVVANVERLPVKGTFDYIIVSDILNDLWDIEKLFRACRKLCSRDTRIIINCYSRLWQIPLMIARKFGLAQPLMNQNWVTSEDVQNLLYLSEFETIRTWSEVLCPLEMNKASHFLNSFLVRMPFFNQGALTNFVIARPHFSSEISSCEKPSVSILIPARNEAGNIREILERTPNLGSSTEIIFVEGNSTDETYSTIEKEISNFPGRKILLFKQTGKGKGDAVRLGFSKASGDILMILDADMTVAPEDLPRFYEALVSGKGDFINGIRLVYPMENNAMRFFNLIGNKFFSMAFSAILGQNIKDTLCGTKVLWRKDYEKISSNRSFFGDFDPFGDFDLLFGAAKLNLKIIDMPIRYKERKYGETNIERWKHGWMLLQMVIFAARKLKFR
ncbi:MAG: glycosyltransferase [Candidatus Riflebacteria bacterium]|nr:glycosyltransferase [Candidatus Riflebacteria bacterium]